MELETHLRFLPAGLAESSPSDVFHSAHFAQLLSMLGQKFEFVVFDGPSILESSDAAVLAAAMDQVVMVTQPSRDRRDEIARATSSIEQHGGRVIGLVANCWDLKLSDSHRIGSVPFRTAPSPSFEPPTVGSGLSEADKMAIGTGRSGGSLT